MSTRIPEQKVNEATGHGWDHWFEVLDKFNVAKHGHTKAAKHLREEHGMDAWWCQSVSIQYEHERGLRENRQQTVGTFQVSVTRTLAVALEKAWDAWADPKNVSEWMKTKHRQDFEEDGTYSNSDGDQGRFKKIVPNKRIVFTWGHANHTPGSDVIVEFSSKEEGRCTVKLTHRKIHTQQEAEDLVKSWRRAMDRYKEWLEKK